MKRLLTFLSCVLICLLLGGCGDPKKEAAGLYDKYYGENGSVVKLAMDMYRKSTKCVRFMMIIIAALLN